jgi:hypothetical protein
MSIRVFIGAPPDGLDAECQAVCEYTLRNHSAMPIDLTWMIASNDKGSALSGWDRSSWATPFTGYRWAIPEICGFSGRAIYMDCDTIVRGDVAGLWRIPLRPGRIVAARGCWRFCVSMFDCQAAQPHMLPIARLKKADGFNVQSSYFRTHSDLIEPFDEAWNWLDIGDSTPMSQARIIHYTHLPTQPSRRHAAPRLAAEGRTHWYKGPMRPHHRAKVVDLFDAELEAAEAAGYSPKNYYQQAERAA